MKELLIPLGKRGETTEGSDVSIICYAQTSARIRSRLSREEDISAEIVDLRSIKPLDEKAIFDSVAKTHRVVIVRTRPSVCGWAQRFVTGSKKHFDALDAPIIRGITGRCSNAYNERLEHLCCRTG